MAGMRLQDRETRRPTLGSRLVWLVEDNPEDAKLIVQVLQETSPTARVVHLDDCEDALRCLQSASERTPCLILLAVNAPTGKAFRFLERIKADERLKTIPIVALAQSRNEREVSAGYALGLAGYLIKSQDRAQLCEEMAVVRAYWTTSLIPRTP